MEENIERYRVFFKRLELSAADDPAAAEYLRYTSAQMLEGGFTHQQMFDGVQQSLVQYQSWVEQERRASSDPVKHQQFLQVWFWLAAGLSVLEPLTAAAFCGRIMVVQQQQQQPHMRSLST